ncbi:PLxRFG domain-containing protein [Comamonas aquatica]|uniref:PLxRFG domain-containing protein n=1 Tax=Comamonas aquatica TaxID=225991 RepID=UPI0021B14088|nr:PLxRFG domain-containing protein [Comamonas aquatica]
MAQDTQLESGATPSKPRIYSDAELGFGTNSTTAASSSAPKVYTDAELGFAPQAPSLGRSVGDSAIALGTGVAQGVKMVSDAFGANNAVSRLMGKGIQAAEGLESDYRKAEKQERARKIKAAEDSGSTWEEVKAYAGSMVDAPLDTTLNAVGSVVPTLAAAALTGGGSAAAQLAARAAPVAIGAVQGAGAVKGGIYDAVEQRHLEAGATPEQAAERAGAAQAYTGDNLGSIAAGAGLGMLAVSTGAEAAVRRLARVGAAKQAADASAMGIAKGAAVGAAKEAPMEAVQGGQERLAANLAEQGEGFDTPTMRGVLGQAALEGMAAAPLGGGLGAVEASGRAGRADLAAARHNAEAAAQDAQAKTDAKLADGAMVADAQLQAQQRAQELDEQEAGAPEVPQTTPPDGAAALRAQQEAAAAARQQALEASRAVQEPDDEILQSTGQAEPVRPSEAMGLRADAGGLESVAAMAVDAGLTEQLQAQTAAQQPEAQQKQEQSAQDQQGINAETGEVSDTAREQQIRERLDFLGQQGRAQGWSAEAVAQRDALQQELDLLSPGQRIEQLNAQADAAAAEATDWAGRQYKPNPQELPEHAAQGGPADVGEANEQRRLKKVVQAKGEEASARSQADALQAQGNAAAQLAAKHDLAALRRKKTDEMSTEELQALAADLGPRHVRAKRLQQAIAEREAQPQPAINQGVNDRGPQTDQTQQASPQQPQAGAAPGLAIDSGAPAAGAQAAKLIAQEGNQRREAEQQRKLQASERWTRMTTVERQAAAEQAQGLNAVAKKNLHNRAWADISEKNRKALLDVVVPQAEAPSDMQAFAPETGTLGIPRADMPQVPTQSHGGLVKHLNAQGIAHETTTVDAAALKPTQAEYSPSKVAQAKQATGGRAVIVSNDGHIIDGHHQAMAAAEDGKPVKAIVLDAPVEHALEAVKASPSVQKDAKPSEASGAAENEGKSVRPKPRSSSVKKAEIAAQARADYFTPGNIVKSYGGHDRVVSYSPPDEEGRWSVTVRAVRKQGDTWVDVPNERERIHATEPDAGELKTGPAGQVEASAEQASEFPIKEASASYSGISHSGGQRAKADADEFGRFIAAERDAGLAVAVTEAQKAAVEQAVESLRTNYLAAYGRLMAVRAGTYSSFVAGRSGLNAKQADKRNDALSRAQDTFSAWQKDAAGSVRRAALDARTDEQKQADLQAKQRAAADKAQRVEDADRKLIRKLLSWKKGGEPVVIGKSAQVAGLNFNRDGYPSSVNLEPTDGTTLTDNKFDLASLFRRPGVSVPESKRRVRELVDAVRAEDAAQPAPAAPADSKTPILDSHVGLMDRVRAGEATADQMRESFVQLDAQREAIAAELNTMNKDKLLRSGGYSFAMRHRDSKKPEIVSAMVDAVLGEYSLGRQYGPNTYTLSSSGLAAHGKAKAEALRELVANLTDDDIAQHAQELAQARAELKARREATQQALDNPKTLADFRAFISHWREKGDTSEAAFLRLTPDQRQKYDALEAESTRATREEAKARARQQNVRSAGNTTAGEVIATKHTKHGHDLFVVQLAERVDRDDYETLNASAKRMGGSYSSYRGNGAVPGFQFRSREAAEAFQKLVAGDTGAAQEVAQARRDAFEDDKSQTAVERLRAMAEALDERATEALGADRKVNTARRARFAASADAAARAQQALAGTMRNVAQAIDSGAAKFLDGVRQRVQVEYLMAQLRAAKSNQLQAKYPDYGERIKRQGEPMDAETVDFAQFPRFEMFRSDLASLARQLLEIDGGKKLGASLEKLADDVSEAYIAWAKENLLRVSHFGNSVEGGFADFASKDVAERAIKRAGLVGKAVVLPIKRGQNRVILSPGEAMQRGLWKGDGDKRIRLSMEFVEQLAQLGKRKGSKVLALPWQLESALENRQRLQRMGIQTPAEFRSALRELASLQQEMATPDRIKELERSMVGRANDGLDFFPTSPAVVQSMLDAAEIAEGMAVLEPSAGMGHIADAIVAETGVWPDVVEISGQRRELLEAKGFHLAEVNDFLNMEPRRFFTYGDTFRAPDGVEGIMRGVGGMGSQRVRLEDADGNRISSYYDRSELVPVAQNGGWSGYDRIIMNPPFSDGRDIQHVQHAYNLLRPGGRIVAIMGEGAFFQSNKRAEGFRVWLESVGGTTEKLPDGSFMDPSLPVNTGVAARMVVIDKPGDAPVFRRSDLDAPAFDVQGFLGVMNQGRPAFSEQVRSQAVDKVKGTVDAIRKAWANGPEVVVAFDMADPAIPAAVRQADLQQRSGGANGDPEGFYYEGKAYLLASQLQTPNDAARVLFHESLGHHGLRGAFGKALDGILDEIATVRQADVDAKIQEYGLRGGKALDRRIAAEEVLAEMAQSQPQIGFVKRTVAAIRAWLRAHVPGFNNLKVSDAELIRNYILPARAWVERGGMPALAQSDVGFNRSAMKSVDANVARGQQAMQQVLLDKADQHRAIFRNGLGWVDFTWGDSKRGVAHIIKRRMESDGMSLEDVQRMLLDKVVETIAAGTEVRRTESGLATRLVLDHNGNEAVLVKRKGANGWLLTAYEMVPGASAGGATRPSATQSSATRSRDELGAGTPTILKKNKDVGKKDATQAQNAKPLGERTGPSAPTVKDSSPYPRSPSGEVTLPPASQTDNDAPMFSRSKLADLKTKGLELAHNAMTHPGKVSLWDKTVGTMRHIAQRYPAFKPVFESAQQFIDDVSSVANEAAQMAPRLIPRVESLGDLAKKPISVADNQAIGKALFAGTLDWGRDQHGKAMPMEALRAKYRGLTTEQKAEVLLAAKKIEPKMLAALRGKKLEQFDTLINNKFESTILKAGAAFNHAELKEFFGLNDQQISLYDEARATVDKSLDITARAEMLRTLGRDWDGMREIVMDAPTLTEAWQLLDDELEQRAKQHPDTRDRQATLMQQLSTTVAKAKELMDHGYMPLQRFGKYTVDVVDAAGERVYFGMFESKAESHRMARAMEREYPGAVVTQGTINDQQFKLFAGITPETAELFGAMLGLDAEGNQAKDQAFQEYLKLAKNNHSAMKRLIHRKGIAGYSEDVGRVLASFVYSNARAAATGLNAGKMEAAIHTLNTEHKDQGELGEIAAKLRSYIQDPQEEGQVIRGMLFAQYLGGSIASAMVNMTQPFAVTMPWLSQYGGMAKAGRFMAGALQDMSKSAMDKGFRYAPDLAHALKMAEDDGVVSPQEIHQLMAQARGAGGLRSGDGTKLGDARAKASNLWEKGKVAWGQPFALAEQFNRRSTFIAAYRLAKDQGMDNPAQFARDAVVETQFLYTKANKPQWARGAIGGSLFTFKTYSVSFLELMQRTWNAGEPGSPERAAGRRAVGWAMLMLMLMGGAGGLPFVEDLEDVIDGAGQAMGYNLSSKQWRQEFMAEWLGQELAGFLEQGLSGLPGAPIDVSGRLGMGNLIPGTGLALSKQSNARDLVEMVGPAGDLIQRGFSGAGDVLKGIATLDAASVGRGALEVMPNAVRNAVKGADMAASGIYKDSKGYKVIDTTLDEAVFKMIGFQPRSVAEVQDANSFMQRSKSFYIQTSNEIRAQWAKALFEKDDAAVAAARARLERWNSLNPDQPIRINMPDVWKRAREMGKDRTQRIAETAPTAIRQQMRAVAVALEQGR